MDVDVNSGSATDVMLFRKNYLGPNTICFRKSPCLEGRMCGEEVGLGPKWWVGVSEVQGEMEKSFCVKLFNNNTAFRWILCLQSSPISSTNGKKV